MNVVALREKPTRPVLRYHGGKWLLADWIISHFPPHKIFVEPFGGAASVLMRKVRAYSEIYADLDGEVCNLFRVLRDPAQARELKRQLELTPFARIEFDSAYLESSDPIESARRMLIRSFMGFSSVGSNSTLRTGFRSKCRASGTVPAQDWRHFPEALEAMTRRLQGVVIENRPALKIIKQYDCPETLFYLDPPYVEETRESFGAYRFEMSVGEHRSLAAALNQVSGLVVLSGYPCALYDEELYVDWHRVKRSAFADHRSPRVEVLWLNASARSALQQQKAQTSMFDS